MVYSKSLSPFSILEGPAIAGWSLRASDWLLGIVERSSSHPGVFGTGLYMPAVKICNNVHIFTLLKVTDLHAVHEQKNLPPSSPTSKTSSSSSWTRVASIKSSEVDGSSTMASSGIVGAGAVTLVATEFDTGCAAGMLAALGKEAVTSCGAATLAGLSGRQTCLNIYSLSI